MGLLRFMLLLLGFVFLILAQDRNTELILDDAVGAFLTLALPATLPIYLMVLMFDIIMVIVKLSSLEHTQEKYFFKKVMMFEIGFTVTIMYSWSSYFYSVFI